MNAIIRAKYEAPVLTNEVIAVHLTYLRNGFDSIQAAIQALSARVEAINTSLSARIEAVNTSLSEKIDRANELRAAGDAALSEKIEAVNAFLSARIEAINSSLSARIEAVNKSLSEKIDKANEMRAAGDAALSVKMDKLTEKVLEIQGLQKSLLWVISLATILSAGVSIARTLDWI